MRTTIGTNIFEDFFLLTLEKMNILWTLASPSARLGQKHWQLSGGPTFTAQSKSITYSHYLGEMEQHL